MNQLGKINKGVWDWVHYVCAPMTIPIDELVTIDMIIYDHATVKLGDLTHRTLKFSKEGEFEEVL